MNYVFALLTLFSLYAHAQSDLNDKSVAISGFGTLSALSLESNDRFLSTYQTDKARELNYTLGSLLGINVTTELNSQSRLVLQTVMQGAHDNFAPTLDLAFLDIEVAKNLHLLGGRLVAPVWMFSEEQSVGYSQLWLRPPVLLYRNIPFRNMDGLGARYNYAIGSTVLKLQVFGGNGRFRRTYSPTGASFTNDVKMSDVLAAEVRIENEPGLAIRFGYIQAHNFINTSVELNGVVPAGPLGSINARLNRATDIRSTHLYSLGVTGQWKSLKFVSEAVQAESKSPALEKYLADYFTLGYELGHWTPHLTASWAWNGRGTFYDTFERDGSLTGSEIVFAGLNYEGLENVVLKAGGGQTIEHFTGRKSNTFSQYIAAINVIF